MAIKACPFCRDGGEPRLMSGSAAYVECQRCGMSGPSHISGQFAEHRDLELAVIDWNQLPRRRTRGCRPAK